ncbi:MAG: LrgB family protein [Sphaerochaetaceae bacterium]|nr:LrgB family protein [uncultured Sphaerochaeta sp.]MDC7229758.1 LrgB family protein [Sphaerochaetaceae bacterium]
MLEILSSPLFGISLSVFAFQAGVFINKKLKNPLANPLVIAMLIIIAVLLIFDIPLDAYEEGSSVIYMFLTPVTAVLALSIYRQRDVLRQAFFPIVMGTLAGALAALSSVVVTCNLLGLDRTILASLLSKSVTTPIAIALTEQFGGLPPLTIASTLISGVAGNLLAPVLAKLFGIKDAVAHGVGIGACSHALGTSKALEIGGVQGAMSSISLSFSALWTVLLAPLFF